ncbi:MAG: ATP-binding cassette domain-containing protein [Egibacteraceae bacterium]
MRLTALAWRVARWQPARFAGGVALWMIWWSSPLVLGLALQAIFDEIAGLQTAGWSLGALITAVMAVEVTRLGLFYIFVMAWTGWWIRTQALLRTNLLQAQLASGGPEAGEPVAGSGSAITVFRDDVEDLIQLVDSWVDVSAAALFAALAIPVMLRIDVAVTLVVAVPLALAAIMTRVLTERLRAYRRAEREATAGLTGFLGGVFSSVLAIKVAGAERAVVRRLRALNAERQRTALRDHVLSDGLEAFNGSLTDVAIGLALLIAAPAMRQGSFSLGDLVLFATYAQTLSAFPRWAGRLMIRQRQAQVAVTRMAALMPGRDAGTIAARRVVDFSGAAGRERARPRPLPPAEVRVRGLRYRFPDGSQGVSGIDLDLAAGSFTVVRGPVGSGKTTMLRALVGLLTPIEGTVRWNGQEVADLAAHMIPPRCAYLAQVPRLLSASLRDNLTLGVDTGEELLAAAVRRAALDGDVARMGEGLGTVVGPRGVRLSGGQVQRAATARALLTDPALLVLDDLSSALDAETERLLWARLRDDPLRRPTCLVVSHRAAALDRADQLIDLEHGRIRAVSSR